MTRPKRLKSGAGRMRPDQLLDEGKTELTFWIDDTQNPPRSQSNLDNTDRMTPDFAAYPWRGILRTLYHAIRRDLPALEEFTLEVLRKEAKR